MEIEFKYNNEISVFFTPKENGKSDYWVTIHDFGNLDGRELSCDYNELQHILNNPASYIRSF